MAKTTIMDIAQLGMQGYGLGRNIRTDRQADEDRKTRQNRLAMLDKTIQGAMEYEPIPFQTTDGKNPSQELLSGVDKLPA